MAPANRSGAIGEPPNVICRSERSASCTGVPASSRRPISVGTRNVCVTPSSAMARASPSGSNRRSSRLVAPDASTGTTLEPEPWETGVTWAKTAVGSSPRSSHASMFVADASRPRWVWMAPFGRPVVPLV